MVQVERRHVLSLLTHAAIVEVVLIKGIYFNLYHHLGLPVDFYDSPHNDVTRQSFIPVEKPIPSVKGDWQVFPIPIRTF